MCVRSQSQPGRENQHKLLYSFHRFLSCPIPGPGITSEETSLRYTAFVWFFFPFFLKKLFPSTFSLPHTQKIPHRKELQIKEGLSHHAGRSQCMSGISGFAQVRPVGQNTEIIAKGQLGTDLIDTGYSCLIHCITLVPPGWRGLRATHWQDFKAKVCHTPKARGQYPLVFQ